MIDKHITLYWLQSQQWIKCVNNVDHILSLDNLPDFTGTEWTQADTAHLNKTQYQLTQKCKDSGFLHQQFNGAKWSYTV